MKTTALVIMTLSLFAAQAQPGVLNDKLDLSLSARGRNLTGYTTYTINFSELYLFEGASLLANYKSELEFPLDVFVTEFRFSLGTKMVKNLPWSLNVAFTTNTNNPGNSMKDSDWLQVPQASFDEKLIYSESNTALDADFFDIYGRAAVWSGKQVRLDVLLGYEYQKMSFDVTGLEGWQLDTLFNRQYFSGYDDELVGTYEVKYQMPYLGVATNVDVFSNIGFDAVVKGSPLVSSKDTDDHVLRNKVSVSDGTGAMISIDGGLTYTLFGPGSGLSWVAGLGYEYTYISSSGTQTQSWYGDDPATSYDDTGTAVTGIHHELKSNQHGVFVTVAARF